MTKKRGESLAFQEKKGFIMSIEKRREVETGGGGGDFP